MQGDAAALPFADCTFPAVAALWVSTDVDDFTAVLAEATRVLEPAGLIVFYGAHPCFNGPHAQWGDDGGVLAHPTYRPGRLASGSALVGPLHPAAGRHAPAPAR